MTRWIFLKGYSDMEPKYHVEDIKIIFSAPDPEKTTSEQTLTINEKDPSKEQNFQWINYLVLFSVTKDKDVNYYIFKMPLNTNGSERGPNMVFDSDSTWSEKNVKTGIPTRDITPGEVKIKFPEILKGPNLHPKQQVGYINDLSESVPKSVVPSKPLVPGEPKLPVLKESGSVHVKPYSSEEFKRLFNNNFYVVVNPKSKELKNPFGKSIGLEPSEEKMALDSYRQAVRAAKESAMSGGFDIMQQLVKKQHKKQKIRKK
jgi:hypothetical protein